MFYISYSQNEKSTKRKILKPCFLVRGIIINIYNSMWTSKMEDYKFLFKVVLVGNAGVGKTCLVRRFTQGMFPPGQGATIGVDFMIKTVEIDGEKIKVSISLNCKGN